MILLSFLGGKTWTLLLTRLIKRRRQISLLRFNSLPCPSPLDSSNWLCSITFGIEPIVVQRPWGIRVIPCTQGQFGRCVGKASYLRADPWFQAMSARPGTTPIAKVYVPKPRSNTVEEAIDPQLPPAAPLWHKDVSVGWQHEPSLPPPPQAASALVQSNGVTNSLSLAGIS